ncbi:MAG: hypothetical protein R3Y32_06915 [Bacillota bacterium]
MNETNEIIAKLQADNEQLKEENRILQIENDCMIKQCVSEVKARNDICKKMQKLLIKYWYNEE